MPKVSSLESKAEYRDHSSRGKFSATDVQIDWEGLVLHYKWGIFRKELPFKDVVAWGVHAEPGGKPDKFGRLKILHIIKLSTAKEMREFSLPPDVFETWLYWIIRSLIKHSKAPMPEEQVSKSPLLEKHKVKAITSQNISEFDRIHHTFVNTLNNLEGGGELHELWKGKFKGAGGTHLDFKDLKKLGEGGSGTQIFKIRKLLEPIKMDGSTEPVVVKMSGTEESYVDDKGKIAGRITDMIKEARVLAALGKHPNIVGLVDTAVFKNRFCLFLEMGSGGDLKGRKDKTPALTRGQVIKYAMDILAGIDHMHQRRIYHMDMKPENVILCKGDIAKIIDFGFSKTRILEESKKDMFDDVQWYGIGTKGYISPESWDKGAISKEDDLAKRDSYAVGMTIFNALLSPYCKWKEFDDSITGDKDSKDLSGKRIDHLKKLVRDEANRKKLISDGLLILADAASGLIEENPKIRLTCGQALEFIKVDQKQHRRAQISESKDALTALKELHFVRDQLKKSRD